MREYHFHWNHWIFLTNKKAREYPFFISFKIENNNI
jgi:hypothetical protein